MNPQVHDPPTAADAPSARDANWPVWKKVLAYLVMAAISLAAIYLVDVKVHRSAVMPLSRQAK